MEYDVTVVYQADASWVPEHLKTRVFSFRTVADNRTKALVTGRSRKFDLSHGLLQLPADYRLVQVTATAAK